MVFPRSFTQSFQRWRQKRSERQGGDDPFEGMEQAGETKPDKDATDRFRRRRGVDYDAVFEEPAKRSRSKHRSSGQFCDPLVADMLQDFWATFFACFRDDEQGFELEHFKREAAEVQEQLDEFGPDGAPDLVTCRQMLFLMSRFARERFDSWSARIDEMLMAHSQQHQELEAIKLTSCWQTDELNHCKELVTNAIKQRDMRVPAKGDGVPPTLNELICALLGIQAQPPRPQAHTSRMRRKTPPEGTALEAKGSEEVSPESEALERKSTQEAEAEGKLLLKVMRDMINGKTTLAKLTKAVEDRDLARELLEMSGEFHRNRGILARVGLLPDSVVKNSTE
ncbi:MAG: hypothetical protein PF961_18290 [Planctomycetota bacterium]|jgi:hypothetical protein|nr:hypothetical protein [Planctomycetota bacterium]